MTEGLRREPLSEAEFERLRKRREQIVRELTQPRALGERETLQLMRELREIRARLKGAA